MKKLALISILALYNTFSYADTTIITTKEPDIANNRAEQTFRKKMKEFASIRTLTNTAGACFLRSEQYRQIMEQGVIYQEMYAVKDLLKESPNSENYARSVDTWVSEISAYHFIQPEECKRFVETGALNLLDQYYYKVTNGYR